jgi:sulfur relay (sulfurtransferase) complex TusBCD TusD component (DsrE family)
MAKEIQKRGRPAGIRASQLALQQKLFAHPDNNKVIEAVYRAALDDEHRNQAAAQKLLMDRMLPISVCDKAADVRQAVKITINSVPTPDRDEKVIN